MREACRFAFACRPTCITHGAEVKQPERRRIAALQKSQNRSGGPSERPGMTEDQWPTSQNPEAMLNALTDQASPRKLRLYAVGCCRRIWHLLRDDRCKHAVEVAQRFVDGRATTNELE